MVDGSAADSNGKTPDIWRNGKLRGKRGSRRRAWKPVQKTWHGWGFMVPDASKHLKSCRTACEA